MSCRVASADQRLYGNLHHYVDQVLSYERQCVVNKAIDVLPWIELTKLAKENVAGAGLDPNSLIFWDFLMAEAVKWFKRSFFKWMTAPKCSQCGCDTSAIPLQLQPTQEELNYGASRIEGYRCTSCDHLERFPRYNSVEKLLGTCVGRCGEWANCFTFLCRVLQFNVSCRDEICMRFLLNTYQIQVRYVVDLLGDHVWTEYYSLHEKRWIHVDPCEEAIDRPLMYEAGWKKEITFICAFARDHVADVTMRYSSNHGAVINRRLKSSFESPRLYNFLWKTTQRLKACLMENQRKELDVQLACDLVNMMVERTPGQESMGGRTSGSMAWIMSRGEGDGQSGDVKFVFRPSARELACNKMHMKYNCRRDMYERTVGQEIIPGWRNGTYSSYGVFRKEERDWKKAYLARLEGRERGSISWLFEVSEDVTMKDVRIRFCGSRFEDGDISVTVTSGETQVKLNCDQDSGGDLTAIPELAGTKTFCIDCKLSGGVGDCAWQHAQLFRESTESDAEDVTPFEVIICFE
ncbi:unnamed protein product [Notodromas monacha]|uniref:Peptide-N(4)-(N-acetyl-beta-glucosaminyl)asparagine amidase n=1 Tax=Notodromas monacha TaxID=399045 RepID=A0A7R9GFX9_9CRUS|nr:unnamed protein product [Notodromas monacha]CAG0919612.1 unnamed protein product [Notodromas monacha]